MNNSLIAPDFEKITWKCPCCNQERTDKYIKVMTHDISKLFDCETGTMFINCRYCTDMEQCSLKAHDRAWIINRFLKNFITDEV
jgi:hypothetical protein